MLRYLPDGWQAGLSMNGSGQEIVKLFLRKPLSSLPPQRVPIELQSFAYCMENLNAVKRTMEHSLAEETHCLDLERFEKSCQKGRWSPIHS